MGLIVAGVAISAQIISQSTYDAIIGMVIVTTVIAPILLKRAYDKTPVPQEETNEEPYVDY